jgi:hypothetical protein
MHKGPIEDRVINYVKLNCEEGNSPENSILPPKELAIYLQKKLWQFRNHSLIAINMLLMNAHIITLY